MDKKVKQDLIRLGTQQPRLRRHLKPILAYMNRLGGVAPHKRELRTHPRDYNGIFLRHIFQDGLQQDEVDGAFKDLLDIAKGLGKLDNVKTKLYDDRAITGEDRGGVAISIYLNVTLEGSMSKQDEAMAAVREYLNSKGFDANSLILG